jgi:hypothetical protein
MRAWLRNLFRLRSLDGTPVAWWSVASRVGAGLLGVYLIACIVLAWWWNEEPEGFSPQEAAAVHAERAGARLVTGYTFSVTLIELMHALLDKRGGYLSNDRFPPGIWMDNVPSFEYGALVQVRDASRALRVDMSRSQSQSAEDRDLSEAEPKFFFDNASWIFPQTESVYREGVGLLEGYVARLGSKQAGGAQFYARADNLRNWLAGVETRLGSLSQRLSSAVGKRQLDLDTIRGETDAEGVAVVPSDLEVKTPWLELDDVFYEARGQCWALIHLLKAADEDFAPVLENKNARVSLQQIIRELESTQQAVWSPIILNGTGFGLVANHSLVMASHISRANAAIIDLRALLAQG